MTEAVYTVTPPDLRLSTDGTSIMLLGVSFDDSDLYVKLFDKIFVNQDVTVYTSEDGLNDENIAWYRAVTPVTDIVIVDIDNATIGEVFLGLQAEKVSVYWISQHDENSNLHKLLNSYQYTVFSSVDEIGEFLESEIDKNT